MGTATVIGRDELGRIIDVQVTTDEDIAPPGPETVAAGGGVQQVRLITGTVQYNATDIETDPGALWTDEVLPSGTTIVDYWADQPVALQLDGLLSSAYLALNVATDADPEGSYQSVKFYNALDTTRVVSSLLAREITAPEIYDANLPSRVTADCKLRVNLSAGDWTAGTLRIYALIAEPA